MRERHRSPIGQEEQLFAAALALPALERNAYLNRACGEDKELRARVEALVRDFHAAARFIDERVWRPRGVHTRGPTETIGAYRLRREIGEGGYGVVYHAVQLAPVRRDVALKIIKRGMDTAAVIRRFDAERAALARMTHPNIASVIDAGATSMGRPYFVMELVRGVKITDYCDQARLSASERIQLFLQVCDAIQHAHEKGVIHRDIKPSNVLVTLQEGEPVAKVIDFGIAKAIQGRLTDETLQTILHDFIGTPTYVSPEQLDLERHSVDVRTDVYSLGVLLYELLTGCTPFDSAELLQAGIERMKHCIRCVDPPCPSRRLRTLSPEVISETARRRESSPSMLLATVRGELDWIVMRCLEKSTARRYANVSALADDLDRFLRREPVHARSKGIHLKARRFVYRHRAVLATSVGVLSAAIMVPALSVWLASHTLRAEEVAQIEAANRLARETLDVAQRSLGAQHPQTVAAARNLANLCNEACTPTEVHRLQAHTLAISRSVNSCGSTADSPAGNSGQPKSKGPLGDPRNAPKSCANRRL